MHDWPLGLAYPLATSQQSHRVPQHVVIGIDVGGRNSDVPVTHQPHENPNAGAHGSQCGCKTSATTVAAGSFNASLRAESQEELGGCVGDR